MRYDVYLAVKAFAETSTLTGEDDRLLKRILRDYRRVGSFFARFIIPSRCLVTKPHLGMHLDKETRAQLKVAFERFFC